MFLNFCCYIDKNLHIITHGIIASIIIIFYHGYHLGDVWNQSSVFEIGIYAQEYI